MEFCFRFRLLEPDYYFVHVNLASWPLHSGCLFVVMRRFLIKKPGDCSGQPTPKKTKSDAERLATATLYEERRGFKAVGPFYLVSMPGEVKDPAQGVNV